MGKKEKNLAVQGRWLLKAICGRNTCVCRPNSEVIGLFAFLLLLLSPTLLFFFKRGRGSNLFQESSKGKKFFCRKTGRGINEQMNQMKSCSVRGGREKRLGPSPIRKRERQEKKKDGFDPIHHLSKKERKRGDTYQACRAPKARGGRRRLRSNGWMKNQSIRTSG